MSTSGGLSDYSIGKVLGEGGFCEVRLGVHHQSKRKVAIKVSRRVGSGMSTGMRIVGYKGGRGERWGTVETAWRGVPGWYIRLVRGACR